MSRFTNNLLGVARKHSATGLRHPDFQQPGFRIPKGPKRARSPEYDAEDLPEWAEFDENESLAFLDRNMEYEHPAVLDKVAEPNGLDAIHVTNDLFDLIEKAPPNDPISEIIEQENVDLTERVPIEEPSIPPPPELPTQEFVDDFDELALEHDREDNGTMFPPSRRSSIADLSEEVPHTRASSELKPFILAFGLWCQVAGVSRHDYQSLLEVFELLDDLQLLKELPRKISTLKKHVQQQLPIMKLRKQEVAIAAQQQPTQGPKDCDKPATETMYFFDPIHLFKTVLSSSTYRAKIHTGLAHFVDRPSELYHSMAWASSIKSCSGEYAKNKDGTEVVLPSDCVYYRCLQPNCWCRSSKYHFGRVCAVGKDYTSSATVLGAISILVNPLLPLSQFQVDQSDYSISSHSSSKELFLLDKDVVQLSQEQVHYQETDILFDYRYEGPNISKKLAVYKSRFVVRTIWDSTTRDTRPLMQSPPLRAELELATHGRTHLINFSKSPSICLPILTFIDAFGLYRNMYRSILGIYATIAGLNWRERKRRANVLSLALGPHGSQFSDVIKVLEPGLTALDKGVSVEINDAHYTLCVFTLAFTGDMKQQMESSGFGSPLANRGCGKCLITKLQKADLTFNTLLNARYHHRVLYERRHAATLSTSKAQTYLKALGMSEEQTPLIRIAPALDIIRSRPTDAAHSEFAGIAKQAQYCLIDAILTEDGRAAYSTELRHFSFPPTWGRLQSPTYHLKSYRMQECARLSIITPVLLRTWLQKRWIQPLYLKAVEATICPSSKLDAVDSIVQCYALMAKSNTVILAHSMSSQDRAELTIILRSSRKAFQRLYQCAALASASDFKKGELPNSIRSSPAISQDNSDEESEVTTRFEDSQFRDLQRSDFDTLSESYSISGRISKKAAAYRNFMSRPNVHVGLHFDEVASEYATPNNVVTFSGEDKHRGFKADVLHTNYRDVTKVLLSKEATYQTVRFALSGSFANSEKNLTSRLLTIHKHCPNLLDTLLPYSERTEDDQVDSRLAVTDNTSHQKSVAIGCLQRSYVQSQLGWPLWPGRLVSTDPFAVMLRQAYEIDFQERNVTLARAHGIQWCQKLAFTDRESEHRIVFQIGDFITVRSSGLARLDGVFLHELSRGKPRLFAHVTMVEDFDQPKLDPVLQAPYLKLAGTKNIVGLPSIGCTKHYILNVKRVAKDEGGKRLERGGQILLLYVNYNIQFL